MSVSAILCQLESLSTTLTTQLLPRFRPEFLVNHNDSAFRLLEHFEATIVENTIRALITILVATQWFFSCSPPPEQMVKQIEKEVLPNQIEKEVLSDHQLYSGQAWFKVTSLSAARNACVDTLKHTSSSHTLSLTRRAPTALNVSSAVLKDRHTSASRPWKPFPNCVLDANARRVNTKTP